MSARFYVHALPAAAEMDAFDAVVSACFAVGRSEFAVEARVPEALSAPLQLLGVRLLGSADLLGLVMDSLGDGPAEGDLAGALAVLYGLEQVELGGPARTALEQRGLL